MHRTIHTFIPSKRAMRILAAIMIAMAAVFVFSFSGRRDITAEEQTDTARPSANGSLHVEGTYIVDEHGKQVALRGISTHGLTWFPEFVDQDIFTQLAQEWDCNLIRLAMYSEQYCTGEKEESLEMMLKGIEAAIAADMYVLVDWHILNDSDPNQNIEEAKGFFTLIAERYRDCPNIIYEICNEPNGDTTWADVTKYADVVIPLIRGIDPSSLIIVGTPDYDRALMAPLLNPLPYEDVMYTCHFYTASHYDALFSELQAALERGLPVFITECGLSEASGDGRTDYENAAKWFSYVNEHKLAYAIWSLSDKPETSAMIRSGSDFSGRLEDRYLTETGIYARALVQGQDPQTIPVPDAAGPVSFLERLLALTASAGREGVRAVSAWPKASLVSLGLLLLAAAAAVPVRRRGRKNATYDTLTAGAGDQKPSVRSVICRIVMMISIFFSLQYLGWRIVYSVPAEYGWLAAAANLILLAVELLGFVETLIHYESIMGMKEHPLPKIPEDAWPDVDIFIATYNEPTDLLRRTVNGCVHLEYPDKDKVHIWICDDNRRPEMRELAEEMSVGYFDRPDNKGAKAGNLNHAMQYTSAPYILTLDADMIVRREFLLKTIPYFVDIELRNRELPEEERVSLGLLQTPQCFYDPDVFQHALYSEHRAPNEQDFFYRTIEPAKTSANSVIYGGSNTVISRKALEAAGGFYTESITEDFATGILIEAAGFVSLGLSEPLASGRTPHTFAEHIQQRTRWGRGVIVTAKKLGILKMKGLSLLQKISYWSSVVYWYSPLKNMIYILSPLLFAVFGIPVFRCTWLELLIYWLPMFILQDISLRLISGNAVSTKWSAIYETSVMPHLLLPVIKETLGMTMSTFKVTDKTAGAGKRRRDTKSMTPFTVLIVLSVIGIIRILFMLGGIQTTGLLILLFWLIRNMYCMIMVLFLIDGRDSDGEVVHVLDAEPVTLRKKRDDTLIEGVTTHLTEHSLTLFLDESGKIKTGDSVEAVIDTGVYKVQVRGVVIADHEIRNGSQSTCTVEILDFRGNENEYLQILYDRIPTLPQNLNRDFGILTHLYSNIAHRMANTKL
ncbi:MAG: cellulase family glycosylhydrolase [Solobacterium sp.]|nr:cellulase family glycosylhydrolase [Solobacterium sp.]